MSEERPEAGNEAMVESVLSSLTRWDDPAPQPPLWERALNAEPRAMRADGRSWVATLRRRVPAPLAAALAIGVVGVLVAGFMQAGEQGSTMSSRVESLPAVQARRAALSMDPAAAPAAAPEPAVLEPLVTADAGPASARSRAAADAARSVVRRATVELLAADVRGSAAKAMHLVNPALGEYVQESAVTGAEESLHATITLRVAAERLGPVLDVIRGFGEVTAETLHGDDVTAQVVDLEARLRNEQRVERELLELLARREGAPLKEILELREQLARVRGEIERLTAQRDRLSHMVSLATVLVIIRDEAGPWGRGKPKDGSTLGAYLSGAVGDAWGRGVRLLIDSLALLVRVAVGGAVIWAILAVIGVLLWRWARSGVNERGPAPLPGRV